MEQALKNQICEAAMIIDREEGHGYAPWAWPDSEFDAIYALCDDAAIQRSFTEWDALVDVAFDGENGELAGRLRIAQRLLEL